MRVALVAGALLLGACDAQTGMRYADGCMAANSPSERIDACNRWLNGEDNQNMRGIALSNRAFGKAELGDTAGAIQDYEAALVANPDDPRSLNRLGELLLNTGDAEGARRHLHRAIEVHGSGIAVDLLATHALREGDNQAALDYYDGQLERGFFHHEDVRAMALYGRGIARLRLGDEGQSEIDQALEIDAEAGAHFAEQGITPP